MQPGAELIHWDQPPQGLPKLRAWCHTTSWWPIVVCLWGFPYVERNFPRGYCELIIYHPNGSLCPGGTPGRQVQATPVPRTRGPSTLAPSRYGAVRCVTCCHMTEVGAQKRYSSECQQYLLRQGEASGSCQFATSLRSFGIRDTLSVRVASCGVWRSQLSAPRLCGWGAVTSPPQALVSSSVKWGAD